MAGRYKVLDKGEYDIFMARIGEVPLRDRCVLLFLTHTGVRNGEFRSLKVKDVFSEGKAFSAVYVHNGHGHHEVIRRIPLSALLASTLEAYYAEEKKLHGSPDPEGPLFFSLKMRMPVSERTVERIVERWSGKWLERPVHPHALRHTFATRLMRESSIRIVQELLGHRSLNTTMIYTHPGADDCNEAVAGAFG